MIDISSMALLLYIRVFFSQEMPRSGFTMELDAASATWLTNDVAVFSTKSGELLLLTLVYDGRFVTFCFHLSSYRRQNPILYIFCFTKSILAFNLHILSLTRMSF